MAPHPEGLRWFQIPLSSARVPRSVIFSHGFQAGLQRYQQLRALKHLRVGRPVAPPPPGLLEPCPPDSPPADSPPRASKRPRGGSGVRAPRRHKDSPGTKKRVSRSRQSPGPTPPRAIRRDGADRDSPPCQETPDTSSPVPVTPVPVTGSLGGDANIGQHTTAGQGATVPQQEGNESGGHLLGTATGWVSSTDSEDDDLTPLRDVLVAGDEPPSPVDHQVGCPRADPLANSLESPVQEKREQSQAATQHPDLSRVHVDNNNPWKSLEENTELSKDNSPPCAPGEALVTLFAVPTAPRRHKDSPGTKKRVSRSRQPPGPTPPRAIRRDGADRDSPPCQVTPDTSSPVPVTPVPVTGSLGGDANIGQHTTAGQGATVPQQEGNESGGHLLGTATGWVSSTDSEDDDLTRLRDVLVAGDEPPSPVDHQVGCPRADPLANSLESPVQEKREQSQAATQHPDLSRVHVDNNNPWKSLEEDTELSKDNRGFLARHTVTSRFLPTIHPGEPVFCAHPAPVPTLDTRGLKPQSVLEGFFFCNSPACQAALVRDGGLSLLYRCVPTCPLPVLRWLFQPWCPTVREISGAFTRLGADLSPLRRQRLLPPEFCPTDGRSLDPSFSPMATPDATNTLTLVTQLGNICKFLGLCVVTQPSRYPDGARLALVTLLCFLGLDRALRCHPLPELQHLLHCLLGGIRDWQGQLPTLCLSLCQLSGHHHNLVALVGLLPDLTKRDRELRRCLSLHAVARLLREPPATVPPPGAQAELEVLGQLLALARPDALRHLVATSDQEKPEDLDQEACYMSYSLLLLASNVVGTENPPPQQRGYLERLCGQLDQHFGRGLQESPCLFFHSQLKSLATLLFVKWQEMLA
ncbi:PREDICTED: SMC5-SMC6 complex localization factor protein 2-like [Calidris pugnax]|uniref:SMC5-SMC6 complex localization factor protein 2-like n=1 Tax=Calidris pugnax TaxID=198806 RepID=UPI00071DD15F|nr:PREDICTED: SMC5-SMC6 complex localization factor protein 2-like [Calidris pugnax]